MRKSEVIGYAAAIGEKIEVKTVSDTERAAMVNWLVISGTPVFSTTTDEMIVEMFAEECLRSAAVVRRPGQQPLRIIKVRIVSI
ncbi:MAG: hypothetical protein C5B50_00820 [Verrucomicrobia bacterium]|nr:MAG: hypothetical protein C5B50_00820 [Verrucomicrobiota bacterium]